MMQGDEFGKKDKKKKDDDLDAGVGSSNNYNNKLDLCIRSREEALLVNPLDFLFRNQNVPPGDAILNPESIFCYSP